VVDDTSIAPPTDASDAVQGDGGDPIAAYRRYLEANTGERAAAKLDTTSLPPRMGPPDQDEGRDPDDVFSTPNQGGMPDVPGGPQIAPTAQGQGPQTDDGAIAAPGGEAGGAAPPMQAGPAMAPAGQQGAGPDIAPVAPTASMMPQQGAGIGGGGGDDVSTPTIDAMAPSSLNGPQNELAPDAPQAPQAKKAKRVKDAPNVAQAPQAPQAPTIDGAPPAAGADDGLSSDPGQATPASDHVIPGAKTPDGKPLINIHPPGHDPSDFDPDKLKDVHTAADLFDALSVAKQSQYMNWWEKQHGDIDDRYNALQADLGQRPDPNRDPTKTEKFTELMNFGLHLLANNKRGSDPIANMGEAALAAQGTQQAKQQAQTSDFDARSAAITKARQADQKDLGTYGQAVREDAINQNTQTRTAIAAANAMKPPKPNQPTTRVLKDGTQVDYDPASGTWNPSVDASGKPLGPMNPQGPRGGASSAGGSKQVEALDALEARGYSTADATNMVFHVKPSGDAFHDYVSIMNKNTPAGATSEEKAEAAQTAEDAVNHMYGPNALAEARQHRNAVISGPKGAAPPPPPPGKIGVDAQGNRWKNVNGVAVQVPPQ
jgi:hypothetical protein